MDLASLGDVDYTWLARISSALAVLAPSSICLTCCASGAFTEECTPDWTPENPRKTPRPRLLVCRVLLSLEEQVRPGRKKTVGRRHLVKFDGRMALAEWTGRRARRSVFVSS